MKNNHLTEFNEGGLHHQNPLGGIPIGQNASVEEGETKNKDFIYSNRISIDENMTKEMNLPNYIKGKTFAEASKAINNKFKDRFDKYSTETKNTFLERLKQAQETLKQQEQERALQIAQSMKANQQEIPDMMNGETPEGMEEFTERKQMVVGGDTRDIEVGNTTGGMTGLAGKMSPYLGAATGALSLAGLAQGNGATTNQFSSGLNGAMQGAQAGMGFGPVGAGIGAAIGIGAGLIGSNKANKAKLEGIRQNAMNINSQFSDKYSKGGPLKKPWEQDSSFIHDDPNILNPLLKPTNTIPQVGAGSPSNFLRPSMKSKNILPKAPTADMDTNVIKNFHDILNISPTTPGYGTAWGDKSNTLMFQNDAERFPNDEQIIRMQKEGKTKYSSTKEDILNTKFFKRNKRWGLTPEGYKYLDPETPNTAGLVKPDAPFVEPTGVQAGMEAYYQKNKTTDTSDTQDNQGNWLDRNGGKILKYAPVAMNAFQLAKLKKPTNQHLQRLSDKFKPEYVDESQLQNIANQEMSNTINSVGQLGGSQGAMRNSIIGAGLNKTKALSDAYMSAEAQNRATNQQGQQFNLGVNQFNAQTQHKESENWERNAANYETQKSKLLSSIGTDLGAIGKEEVNKNQIAEALGYSWDGKYMTNKKTGKKITLEQLSALQQAQDTETKAYGGYLNMKKIGRR